MNDAIRKLIVACQCRVSLWNVEMTNFKVQDLQHLTRLRSQQNKISAVPHLDAARQEGGQGRRWRIISS